MSIFAVMSKLQLRIFLLILAAMTCREALAGPSVDDMMRQLDKTIADRPVYLDRKEERLRSLRVRLDSADNDRARFDILSTLFDEYHPFNTDSAYNISRRQEVIARRVNDREMLVRAQLNKANTLSATGMFHETLVIVDSINVALLPDYLKSYYFHTKRTLYGRMSDYATFADEKDFYDQLTDHYCDSLLSVYSPGTLAYELIKADRLNVHGQPEDAIAVLDDFIGNNRLSEHEEAICAWTIAESCGLLGDREGQKKALIKSAVSDMKSSVREYASLRQLALLLYQEGDLKRAYDYMTIALDDAAKCSARQRIVELNDTYPMINGLYLATINRQKKSLEKTVITIAVLSLLLVAGLFIMRAQMRKIARARRQLEDSYSRLNQLNNRLTESNEKLSEANAAIADNSRLKETYIGRYMDQCIAYIERLDAYRRSVAKLVASGKNDELKRLVKSNTLIDDEIRQFYEQFDHTFLSLFPTFVEEFNQLLLPDEAIIPKKEGALTPELRIFALIRLGISDSENIAKFLRYSLTTIYNYRTKVRNKTRGDRSNLEADVMRIGRS